MEKLTHSQQKSLHELLVFRKGVTAASDWATHGGGWHTRRVLPAFSSYIPAAEIETHLRGAVLKAARKLIKKRPRIKEIVAVTDLRAARRILRANDWSLVNPWSK